MVELQTMMAYAATRGMVSEGKYVVDTARATASTVAFDRESGSPALEQHVLRLGPGPSASEPSEREEALFVLAGRGRLDLGGASHELEPETAVAVQPGQGYEIDNPGPAELVLVSVLVPPASGAPLAPGAPGVVRLSEQDPGRATSDREFRILHEPGSGLSGATQFVGYIPSKRAPEHFHTYDEVIYVLDGEGALHLGEEQRPVGPGACIHLSPELRHCLENTGSGEMRVLGVFRPAGDPSEAYLPDGTRAQVAPEGT